MREIKFRAWDSYDKKMFSWDEITSTPAFEKNIPDYLLNVDRYKCMLKIGLCDKNFKEIYDGDIIKFNKKIGEVNKKIGVVKYDDLYCQYFVGVDGELLYQMIGKGVLRYYEIIGNIYENPELLEIDNA